MFRFLRDMPLWFSWFFLACMLLLAIYVVVMLGGSTE